MGGYVGISNLARKITKAYVGVPASYTPIEYIESSGTQYIDTGYKLSSSKLKIQLKIYTVNMPATEQDLLSNQDNTTSRFALGLYQNKVFGYSRSSSTQDTNVYSTAYSGAQTLDIEANYNYGNSTKSLTVNTLTTTEVQNATIDNSNQTIKLLNGSAGASAYFVGRCYYCKIWDNDTLVRDFIPVLDDNNVACLYEQVEGRFYYNTGTGTFTAGNATGQPVIVSKARKITKAYVGVPVSYTPVEYIESSGTQYIDTGFKMSNNSKIVAKLSMADANIMTAVGVGGSYQSFSIQSYNGNYRIRWRSGTTSNTQVDSSIPIGTTPHIFEANSTNAKIDGTVIGSTNSYQFTESSNLFICAMSSNNSPLNLATGRIYYYQIYEYDVLVKNFIPVIDQDNVACLYELIEGRFYYNKGAGTFTAGSTTGQEVALSPVARLCYSASSLPDTALLLCHLDDSSTNEITGNDAAPTNGIQSYSTGKWDKAATIKATTVASDYGRTTTIYSLRDTNLPSVYNILNGSASPVTVTGWFKSGTNDGWLFAYGYWYYIRYGAQSNYSYRCGVGVAPYNNYLQAKIMYKTSGSGSPLTASLTTDIANTVYADGNWHHYAIEVDSTGMNFYFDGVYKGHVNKPSGFLSDGFSNTVHFSLGDEIMVCSGLLYNKNNFTPPSSPY